MIRAKSTAGREFRIFFKYGDFFLIGAFLRTEKNVLPLNGL